MKMLQRGFTLLEMIIVMVILGIASVAVVTMVANLGAGQGDNRDLQVGTQLLQECGEWIVAQHRRDVTFFDSTLASNTSCYGLSSYVTSDGATFGPPDVVVTTYTGSACPTGGQCKNAAVTISKDGATLTTLNVMLVRYN